MKTIQTLKTLAVAAILGAGFASPARAAICYYCASNGTELNGIKMNGYAWNGYVWNGYVWNGYAWNSRSYQGTEPNGTAQPSTMTIYAVTLPEELAR